ncbi:hypothetical protein [Mesorhizobium abyssinicae]|uniref:hypothetical protein n=1 Tax=Mesorhizobium abyssinicae TaxID=1209958 RepID=UPI0033976F03
MTGSTPRGSHLPSTYELLTMGGDVRIELDRAEMVNKYGCRPRPDNELVPFGSATASTISEAGFLAADRVRRKMAQALRNGNAAKIYLSEIGRQCSEFVDLHGLEQLPGLQVIASPSGTDAHMLVAKLVAATAQAKTLAIMIQPAETGSGVANALAGAMEPQHSAWEGSAQSIEVRTIAIRNQDCSLRAIAAVDDDLEAMVVAAVKQYDRILVVMTDVSKTGVLAPSPSRVLDLKRRWPDIVEILVDAAQFRLAPSTLKSYLSADCLIIVTGSKFVGGPAFSAMLLLPAVAACRLLKQPMNSARNVPGATAAWQHQVNGVRSLYDVSNFGLLLRWEAALAELRAFRAIPEKDVGELVRAFRDAIVSWLNDASRFELLQQPGLHRRFTLKDESWDCFPTIFPFLLFRTDQARRRKPLGAEEARRIYYQMRKSQVTGMSSGGDWKGISSVRCELGQPVLCGELDGTRVGALRLSLSARLIVEAINAGDRGRNLLVERGLTVLEKASFLARNAFTG